MTKLEMTFNSLLINEIYKREKSVEVVFKQVNEAAREKLNRFCAINKTEF